MTNKIKNIPNLKEKIVLQMKEIVYKLIIIQVKKIKKVK